MFSKINDKHALYYNPEVLFYFMLREELTVQYANIKGL